MQERSPYAHEPVFQKIQMFVSENKCKSLLLDIGSHRGVQIRKLFQPECFAGFDSELVNIYEGYFGPNRTDPDSGVCAIGFEPHYKKYGDELRGVEMRFNNNVTTNNKRVKIFIGVAVAGHTYKNATLFHDGYDDDDDETSSLFQSIQLSSSNNSRGNTVVEVIDLSAVIHAAGAVDKTLIKMDIEGAEYAAISSLLASGLFCSTGMVLMKHHPDLLEEDRKPPDTMIDVLNYVAEELPGCYVRFMDYNDNVLVKKGDEEKAYSRNILHRQSSLLGANKCKIEPVAVAAVPLRNPKASSKKQMGKQKEGTPKGPRNSGASGGSTGGGAKPVKRVS